MWYFLQSLWSVVIFKIFLPLDKIIVARQNLLLPTLFFFAVWVISAFRLLAVHLNKKILVQIFVGVLILVVTFDLLRFADKWMPFDPAI